jgi:hypothetical protein
MVRSPAPVPASARFGRLVFWVTRAVTLLAVATQAVLLGLELTWALQRHTPLGEVAGRQGGLFAVTVVLSAVAFWLTAQIDAADPRQRLRHSKGLRLAAIPITIIEAGG